LSDLQNVLLNFYNNADAGLVYWYPESVQVPGYTIYNGGATALFDRTHNGLPALTAFGISHVPGDFNHDGVVNSADYASWRETDGTFAGYNTWREHFGEISSSASGSGGIGSLYVPEPSALMLSIFFSAFSSLRLHRTRRNP
jgi:hypothetical protein